MAHLLNEAKKTAVFGLFVLFAICIVWFASTMDAPVQEAQATENTTETVEVASTYGATECYEQVSPAPKPQNVKKLRKPVNPNTRFVNTKYFPEQELKTIVVAAKRNNCGGDLFLILLAIRKAENGGPGIEFGVLHPKAKYTNLDTQAGWAAATVVKNYQRWQNSNKSLNFITFLGNRYCPVGAANDPHGLNRHWIGNVTRWYNIFKSEHERSLT